MSEFEGEVTKYQKVKTHLQENKKFYLIAASGFVVGTATGVVLKTRPIQIINTVAPQIAPVFINENTVNNAGRLHKIIKRINADGTEDFWETIGEAARDLADDYGLKPSSMYQMISRCINGHIPDVHGDKFVTSGIGTR